MEQGKLMLLLQEASNPDCSRERRLKIHAMLSAEAPSVGADGVHEVDDRSIAMGLSIFLDALWTELTKNHAELLSTFFPAFAIICGDRDDQSIRATVDWSIWSIVN